MQSPSEIRGYQPALDGLRCIAVTSVVIFHINETWLPGGWLGVDVFFALSGYLITRILTDELRTTGRIDLPRFYVRRILRLSPALALLIFCMAPVAVARHETRAYLEGAAVTLVYLMNWARALHFGNQWMFGHTWSLSIEEQFYLIWPAFLYISGKRVFHAASAALGILICWRIFLVAHGVDWGRTYNGFDTHADPLLIGGMATLVPMSGRLIKRTRYLGIAFAVIFLAGIETIDPKSVFAQAVAFPLTGVVTVALIIAVQSAGWLRRVLSWYPFVFTGRISYGWYLWHYPLIHIAQDRHYGPIYYVLAAAMAYIFAAFSYLFIEQPILRLKNVLPIAKGREK